MQNTKHTPSSLACLLLTLQSSDQVIAKTLTGEILVVGFILIWPIHIDARRSCLLLYFSCHRCVFLLTTWCWQYFFFATKAQSELIQMKSKLTKKEEKIHFQLDQFSDVTKKVCHKWQCQHKAWGGSECWIWNCFYFRGNTSSWIKATL